MQIDNLVATRRVIRFFYFLLDSGESLSESFSTIWVSKRMRIREVRLSTISLLLVFATATQTRAATITVTNTNDSGPGSLRQAIAAANDGDRITFAVSGTITLTSGGLLIFKNVTISGPGANHLSINGNQGAFVFAVGFGKTVTFSGLSVTNAGSGILNDQSTVSVSNCVIRGNSFAGLDNEAGSSAGASMTVANSVITNNSGTGAFNLFPFLFSGGSGCACMTITDSVVSNNNADGIFNGGGSFFGEASLTVVNSDVSDNNGGGIADSGSGGNAFATIVSTTVSGNSQGGLTDGNNLVDGIFGFGQSNAQATITDSTISGNSTHGGISFIGTHLTVANSTISGNSSVDNGGGIYALGFATNFPLNVNIGNSTISGNSAGTNGGGIYAFKSALHIANSTISGNSAVSGGGIYHDSGECCNIVSDITNTILNAGASGENIVHTLGLFRSLGYNLSSDDGSGELDGPGDQINTDPLLGPLQDNGGPTFTHALQNSRTLRSPAIDAGNPSFTPPPSYDQRGSPFVRVFNDRIDIGSFEAQLTRGRPTPRPRPTPQ
jgi:hypothetical protein